MSANRLDSRSLVAGTVAGLVAWILGYVLTYLIVAPDVRDSPLNRALEVFDGEPATYEMVGWVFYNAHLVQTVFRDVPIFGGSSTSFLGGDGFSTVLYLVPIGLLLAAGIALARYHGVDTVEDGALAGVTVVPGYFLASLAGLFLFQVSIGSASGAPDFLAGVVMAGVLYPVVVGGVGGAVGGLLAGRAQT